MWFQASFGRDMLVEPAASLRLSLSGAMRGREQRGSPVEG